jgi:hypothetical protein
MNLLRGTRFYAFTSALTIQARVMINILDVRGILTTLLFVFAFAGSSLAQPGLSNAHPNLARGNTDLSAQERFEWDQINLLNGNLLIPLKLGQRYPVTAKFGYQFSLYYNSNIWDLEENGSVITASPVRNANAGLGWDLNFGRLIAPAISGANVGRWVYVSPDGAYHPFYSTLHHDVSESDPNETCQYTRDGSYYRLYAYSPTQKFVEAPDGLQSLFELTGGEWKLKQIGDRFTNRLWFTYSSTTLVLTDNHGRSHTIYYKADPTGYYPALIDRIEIAAFAGAKATYSFTYAAALVTRPTVDTDPATAASINLPLLAKVTLPDGSSYNFTYGPTGVYGRLTRQNLPTLGEIRYTYKNYPYTSPGLATSLTPMYRANFGIATRTVVNNAAYVLGAWTFNPALAPAGQTECEMTNTVQTPLGDKTVHYFSVNTMSNGPDWKKGDYGLPFTKNEFDRPRTTTANIALASSGAIASADSTLNSGYPASAVINGDRKGLNWGNGGGWNDGTTNWFPDSLEVTFSGNKTISLINLFTLQDNYTNPVEPTQEMTFAQYGIRDFNVQYWNGASWVTVPGGSVTNNDKVWRQFSFSPLTTNKIRIVVNNASMSSRIVEVEAYESVIPADARFLSKQVYDCDAAGGNCQLLRSTYVRYEQDQPTDPAYADAGNTNRREASRRTLYHDDVENGVTRFADVDRSDFDGLGHYRRTLTNGNFGSADVRDIYLGYEASTGNYPSVGFQMPAITAPWVLNRFSQQKLTEGPNTETVDFCFDVNTGFMKRVRRWYSTFVGQGKTAKDVVIVYTENANGDVGQEQYYGGDIQAIGTGALCSLTIPATDQYQIRHTYQYGVRSGSSFYTETGQMFGQKTHDVDIDQNTGLIKTRRNSAGIATNYEYDAMERMTWEKPESGHGAWTKYEYFMATGHTWNGRREHTTTYSNGGGTVLKAEMDVFDGFGRLWAEQKLMPGQVWTSRFKDYNAQGWQTHESEWSTNAPLYKQYLNHDPFGRVRLMRPLDGAQHDVTYEYAGVRSVKKIGRVAISYYQPTKQLNEQPRSTTKVYDRQGRLWKDIWQRRFLDGPDKVFVHTYDVAGRLLHVAENFEIFGNRQYFDGRGFMYYEVEAGMDKPSQYKEFDALGKARLQNYNLIDLTFVYDRAARLVKVHEKADAAKVLKEFTYADANGANDWKAGKVVTAKRYNRHNPYAVSVVTESYTYGAKGGRVSQYEVELNDGVWPAEKYTQSYVYNDLGDLEELNYPSGVTAGAGSLGRTRKVVNSYSYGKLTSVQGVTDAQNDVWASSISYHASGLTNQVVHSNGVTDIITQDSSGLTRVGSVSTLGVKSVNPNINNNLNSGSFLYDGLEQLVAVGDKFYVPQDGTATPPPPVMGDYTPSCPNSLFDPLGMVIGVAPSGSCTPTILYYYTASDTLFKMRDPQAGKHTNYFYGASGEKLTEYVRNVGSNAWVSTRDYLYRGGYTLVVADHLPTAPNKKIYHYHIGYGAAGITTDSNGYKVNP